MLTHLLLAGDAFVLHEGNKQQLSNPIKIHEKAIAKASGQLCQPPEKLWIRLDNGIGGQPTTSKWPTNF